MTYYVTFRQSGRTGNILFQYLICKVITLLYGHVYVSTEDFDKLNLDNVLVINEVTIHDAIITKSIDGIETRHILCDGYFQKSCFYVPLRKELLELLNNSKDDYWISYDGTKETICKYLYRPENSICSFQWNPNDIFVSLRLDDFIQLPRETSDIIPPMYYLDIIEKEMAKRYDAETMTFPKLYIVSDILRYHWEHKYLEFFNKWSPIRIQQSVVEDCHVLRDCPMLIHSNSTLCWFMSFLSQVPDKKRYIPKTHFYGAQSLDNIDESDIVLSVQPLPHHNVYNLDIHNYLRQHIYPLSYCIPDECIVDDSQLDNKNYEIAPLVPGNRSTYLFGANQEEEYNTMYKTSLFAHTMKKGGWDCLRHYEIMANGCIPIFKDLEHCPKIL